MHRQSASNAILSSPAAGALVALTLFFVLFPLTPGKPGLPPALKADEPAYYLMSLSLWKDGDLRCEEKDVQRVFREFPFLDVRNLILMSKDGWKTVYFGKPYIYSLFAAPWTRAFGANGMTAFNMALLMGMIWIAWLYLRRYNGEFVSVLFAAGFFLLSNAFSYVFWLHPEVFNMAALTLALYLGLTDSSGPSPGAASRLRRLAASPWVRTSLSGACLTLAVYNKPVIAALGLPVAALYVRRAQIRRLLVWLLACGAAMAMVAGLAILLTGEPSAYLGMERAGQNIANPYELPLPKLAQVAPDATRPKQGSWFWIFRIPAFDLKELAENAGYFLWGRHTGLFVYAPFSLLALILFVMHNRASLGGWLLIAGLAAIALFYFLWIPFNWHGGGGFIGNRYFVNAYPAFLFLVTRIRPAWSAWLGYALGGVLVGPMLFSPFGLPVPDPTLQIHTRNRPYGLFPLEVSVLPMIPGYKGMVQGGAYLLGRKDNFKPKGDEAWILGASRVEIWMKTSAPLENPVFSLRNGVPANEVEIRLEGDSLKRLSSPTLGKMEQWQAELSPHGPWKTRTELGRKVYFYRMTVTTRSGVRPNWAGISHEDYYLGAVLSYLGERKHLDRDLYDFAWGVCRVPERVVAGESFSVSTSLTNSSAFTWPSSGAASVNLAYHWLDEAGDTVVFEGERTALPRDLAPGKAVRINQRVSAPDAPGRYILVLDPIYENVSWFSERNHKERFQAAVVVQSPQPAGN